VSHRPIPTPGAAPNTTSTREGGGDWRHHAECLGEDPELFFPIGNTGPSLLQIEEAKAVCRRCEVMDTCLRWALETGQDAGVWGGLSEDERRASKRRTSRKARTAPPAPPTPPTTAKRDPTPRPSCGTDPGYRAHTNADERQCDACRDWKADTRRESRVA
jgi:WhiB family redox-sensing transcriptional regulator